MLSGVGVFLAAAAGLWLMYHDWALSAWYAYLRPHSYYSHSLLIPIIVAFLVARSSTHLAAVEKRPDAWGLVLGFSALLAYVFGILARADSLIGLSWIGVLAAAVWCFFGRRVFLILLFPILYLLFMLPISNTLTDPLAFSLRLVSTRVAAGCLQLCGLPGQAVGTSISLPTMQIQVPNACSGVQAFMALFAAVSVLVYLARGTAWRKAALLTAVLPVLVGANGVRIALIAMIGSLFGLDVATGRVHDASGIIVFIIAMGVLMALAHVLSLDVDLATGVPSERQACARAHHLSQWLPRFSAAPLGWVVLLAVGGYSQFALQGSAVSMEGAPVVDFATVPLDLPPWSGRDDTVDPAIVGELYVNSLMSRTYAHPDGNQAYMLVEYRPCWTEKAFHHPEDCFRAAGWDLGSRDRLTASVGGVTVPLIRLTVTKGTAARVELYWYRQQGEYTLPGSPHSQALRSRAMLHQFLGRRESWVLFRLGSPTLASTDATYDSQVHLLQKLLPRVEEAIAAGEARQGMGKAR